MIIVNQTYEEERLEYFTALMHKARRKSHRYFKRFKDAPYGSEAHRVLSDAARDAYFHADVVEMLEKQIAGEWILNDDGSGTCTVCRRTQKAVWDDDSHQRYCGCCGAKMKGGEYHD